MTSIPKGRPSVCAGSEGEAASMAVAAEGVTYGAMSHSRIVPSPLPLARV